jgi:hypothetical protein
MLAQARATSNIQVHIGYTSQGVMNDLIWWTLDKIISECKPLADKSEIMVYRMLFSQPREESPSYHGIGLSVPLAFNLTDPVQSRDVHEFQAVAADNCKVVDVSAAKTGVRAFLTDALFEHAHRIAQKAVDAFRSFRDPHGKYRLRGCGDMILQPGK